MKKIVLSLATMATLFMSTNAFAGAMKELVIEAEDAIIAEFYDNGREVTSITNHSLVTIKGGVGVKAKVETVNPLNGYPQTWSCLVSFEKSGNSFSPKDVDCSGI
ncbi:hypothetical protein DOM21_14490 [Bacteriovorax stolpii]|uniref:Uncharacterized protein n=1 Tax=Bacteriovorax stolpii TaxID=960 RepID=A0A2K9NRK7_BACTC|nr:hypothetical protein [Bacteriovorax stolpii]AUN97394.1 hypothetical protein C0V70_04565 [Bacteriovorax stolpii]QDK42636.1 hypothetical protein DOM21_14490 [Bacteriovorax stolpii]TDP52568.1 hypothetical protein C8D79_2333 [Bacteriovorax stolpii]